ncbi:hypothetical protein IW262DRAFT_1468837 [Armillaria fumosa]|nr:hypothetical protein IW262DRAFT_1468837 [Armillaria fumosa]
MPPTHQEQCQYCLRSFALHGLKRHETACKQNFDEQRDNALYEQRLFRTAQTNAMVPSGNDISTASDEYWLIPDHDPELIHPAPNDDIAAHPDPDDDIAASLPETHEESIHGTSEYKRDDIRMMKTLFQLLNPEAASNPSTEFNVRSPKDFKEHWDRAVNLITPFEKSTVTVRLRNKDYTYDVYRQNLWEWALELVQNPLLEPHFIWDAVQLSKWNGDAFEKFVDEPWMVQAFWDLQMALPGGAKVLCFIIYADKTRLSSFGTAQGYPVVARCGNLPIEIRNGNSVGGGRVVGWLPVIKEDAKYRKKVYYVDFKRRVWHAAFKYILEPLFVPSKIGGWVHLSLANTDIQMFPRLPIKSCDYDEANFVVLIWGANGLKPCIICLVPKLEQYNLDIRYELRTKQQTQEVLTDAAAIPTKGARNKFLSGFGLRNIENVFWNIEDCDPFRSLSFDPLHAHDNGAESVGQADDQIKLFPRWRNLYHFESGFMAVHFADGGKYEDLSKHIIFVTHNILTEDSDEHGYHLLKCVRSYIELRMYAGFNLHTERSIQAIRDELLRFSALIREYEQLTRSTDPGAKSWNFPKVHSHQHMVDDILRKGVMLNYNTKPNEKMHGPLKDAYQLRTNFKDVAEQILQVDSWCNAASFICQQIKLHDEQLKNLEMPGNDNGELEEDTSKVSEYSSKVTLHGHRGKGGGVFKIREIRDLKADDPAFHGFRKRLSEFMIQQFEKYPDIIPKVDGEKVSFKSFKPDEEIQLHGLLKVNYENMVDWTTSTDYLRCSPNFYNHPRYDYLLVDSTERPFFAQLIMIFTCVIGGKPFPLALVQPVDQPAGTVTEQVDKDLGFYRGALLVEDFGVKATDGSKDYLVVDCIDSDSFLRMKSLQYTGRRN